MASTAARRARASASRASRRARPTWPWRGCGRPRARPPGRRRRVAQHRRRRRRPAASAAGRAGTGTGWSPRRRPDAVDGAQSRNTVRAGGSSTRLQQRVGRLPRSAGRRPRSPRPASGPARAGGPRSRRRRASPRPRSTGPRARPSGRRDGCGAAPCGRPSIRRSRRSSDRSHCSAAANARAATERPDPGGPVNSQAWVIAPTGSAVPGHDRPSGDGGAPQDGDRVRPARRARPRRSCRILATGSDGHEPGWFGIARLACGRAAPRRRSNNRGRRLPSNPSTAARISGASSLAGRIASSTR